MTFVNEYISGPDREKYDLVRVCGERNLPSRKGHMHSRHWTVDREREIFLIKVWAHQESEFSGYAFYWNGSWTYFEMRLTGVDEKQPDVPCRVGYLIKKFELPASQQAAREELMRDLEESLCTYCGAGVFSTCTHCIATVEFVEE